MTAPKPPKFWEMPGFLFCTAEMKAWVGPPTLIEEMDKPQRGKPKDAAAAARLAAGRRKGKAKNKQMRDALDKAKEKA